MSREDANLIVAMAGLFVALVATGAAIYAIRRDRADLRVTTSDAAAGNRWVTVVNVGLRPVRIERILVRRWRLVPRLGKVVALHASVVPAGGPEEPLPTVVQPAADVALHYAPAEYGSSSGRTSSTSSSRMLRAADTQSGTRQTCISARRGPTNTSPRRPMWRN